jgi:hypothetical protein
MSNSASTPERAGAPGAGASVRLAAKSDAPENSTPAFKRKILTPPRGVAWDVLAASTKHGGYAVLLDGLNFIFISPDGKREIATPAMMRTFTRGNNRILDQIRFILRAPPGCKRAIGSRKVLRSLIERGLLR